MIRPLPITLSLVVLGGGILLAWASSAELPPSHLLCRSGFCGPGRPAIDSEPTNPFVWSDLAESKAAAGDLSAAHKAFDQALRLGPNIPPVLIRIVNFAVANNDFESSLPHVRHILALTAAYDNVLFRYLLRSNLSRDRILRDAIPDPGRPATITTAPHSPIADHASAPNPNSRPAADPARAWAAFLITEAHADAEPVFQWLESKGAVSPALREHWLNYLIAVREDYPAAVAVRAGAAPSGGYPKSNRIFNSRLAPSSGGRLDWKLAPNPLATAKLSDGFFLTFTGLDNLTYAQLTQEAYLPAGRWRFTAIAESNNLTTDQRPFFRITDASAPPRLDISTPMAPATMTADFTVPTGGAWTLITLHRRPSEKFDSKIRGSLTIREVKIEPLHGIQ